MKLQVWLFYPSIITLHMKKLLFLCSLGLLASCSHNSGPGPVAIDWSCENHTDSAKSTYTETIRLTGDLRGVQRLAFNTFPRHMEMCDTTDTLVEITQGYYAIGSPKFANAGENDTIVFKIRFNGAIQTVNYGPDGFHLVMNDGTTRGVPATPADMTMNPASYVAYGVDPMPYGDTIYARNIEISGGKAGVYDAIPSFKNVELTGGECTIDPAAIKFNDVKDASNPEAYKVTIANGEIVVDAPQRQWARIGLRLRNLLGDKAVTVPQAVITDAPTLPYRGLMLDIARNYTKPAQVREIIEKMAVYGLNTLHFHPVDDEAWRLEIKALPELTEVGSRRGYTPGSDGSFLDQMYAGDGNPESTEGTANGYFTRADFVGMLRYADSLGIAVIPEIESPGHARAAIKAMEYRAKRTGDNSWLINQGPEAADYVSAQGYRDNAMNPAIEGPYKLLGIVADEIIDMYKEAGVELPALHIGGDEVAYGSWSTNKAIQELKEKEGLATDRDVHAYFVRRVTELMASKGLKISGWQEIATDHGKDYDNAVAPNVYNVNCWSVGKEAGTSKITAGIAKAGYPVVLSNYNHYYLDMVYSPHPMEKGLNWGGWSDEFNSLGGYPYELCNVPGAKLLGVQAQIWAETVRGVSDIQRMMFPKMLGLAERGWNPEKTYSEADFNAVVGKELPKLAAEGINFHLRQPGLKVVDGKLVANSPYEGGIVRVSLDGTNPTEQSQQLNPDASIDLASFPEAKEARAILWYAGKPSLVTVLKLK